ncbi:uncharacterized protein K460DRAFT_100701 [Cucurbitaria berberidis CBS 394.84]|uniref:Uncharacterized protein n=1 Tax=Cucurbitaria berberidis CBS 394.84 TaxID=1168544 RepID=A0A9P4GGH8_9PLEO|nr:uncharacterized protein K460DRAFT_100701 [Cucurbitaria berberidis CBS 394.84]KAF1844932.1 hypothetical protein K460DRAFT_100701 [Cucurbitaria berberidis CBS 394.84]
MFSSAVLLCIRYPFVALVRSHIFQFRIAAAAKCKLGAGCIPKMYFEMQVQTSHRGVYKGWGQSEVDRPVVKVNRARMCKGEYSKLLPAAENRSTFTIIARTWLRMPNQSSDSDFTLRSFHDAHLARPRLHTPIAIPNRIPHRTGRVKHPQYILHMRSHVFLEYSLSGSATFV